MLQNTEDQWWTGLWDFPRVDVSQSAKFGNKTLSSTLLSPLDLEWLASQVRQQYGIDCSVAQHHQTFKHTVTRYRITLHIFNARISKRNPALVWHPLLSAFNLPLTAPARKILKGFACEA